MIDHKYLARIIAPSITMECRAETAVEIVGGTKAWWVADLESNRWQLVIETKRLNRGPLKLYAAIREANLGIDVRLCAPGQSDIDTNSPYVFEVELS